MFEVKKAIHKAHDKRSGMPMNRDAGKMAENQHPLKKPGLIIDGTRGKISSVSTAPQYVIKMIHGTRDLEVRHPNAVSGCILL